MRRMIAIVLALVVVWAATLLADAPVDIGASATSSGVAGELAADKVSVRDNNTLISPRPNRIVLRGNTVDLTPDPTCANQTAGRMTLIDTDESSTVDPKLCVGTATWFDFPNMGSDNITNGEVMRGTGTGVGDYGKVTYSYMDTAGNYGPWTGTWDFSGGGFIGQRNVDSICSSLVTTEAHQCWATDTDLLYLGNGSTALRVDPYRTQAVSVSSNGTGTAATFNLDPTARYIEITCNDTDGCDGTLQETSAWEPRHVILVNLSANRVRFADVANVLTLITTPIDLYQYGTLSLAYEGTRWVEIGQPIAIKRSGALVTNGQKVRTLDLDPEFSVSCAAGGECDLALGANVSLLGSSIDKAEMTSAVAYEDEANSYGGNQQTFQKLLVEQSNGTDVIDCGITSASACRYTGTYSHADDVATKGDVDSASQAPTTLTIPNSTSAGATTTGRIHLDTNGGTTNQPQITVGDGTVARPIGACWADRLLSSITATTTGYYGEESTASTNQYQLRFTYPMDVGLTNLRCWQRHDQTNATTNTYTLRTAPTVTSSAESGVADTATWTNTALSVSITGTSAAGENQTSVDTDVVAVSAGTYVQLEVTNNVGATTFFGCTWIACARGVW